MPTNYSFDTGRNGASIKGCHDGTQFNSIHPRQHTIPGKTSGGSTQQVDWAESCSRTRVLGHTLEFCGESQRMVWVQGQPGPCVCICMRDPWRTRETSTKSEHDLTDYS